MVKASRSHRDRVEQLDVVVSGPALASLFDGSQRVVSVSAVPYYVRDITIP